MFLSRLTFLKVFCLLTSLSDLKMIGVFTSKIVFHLSNLRRARARIWFQKSWLCWRIWSQKSWLCWRIWSQKSRLWLWWKPYLVLPCRENILPTCACGIGKIKLFVHWRNDEWRPKGIDFLR